MKEDEEVGAAINETELENLSSEVLSYRRRILKILKRVDSSMNRLKRSYQGPPSSKIIDNYAEIREAYPIVQENLKNYSDDFLALIEKMRNNEKILSNLYLEFSDRIQQQINNNDIMDIYK